MSGNPVSHSAGHLYCSNTYNKITPSHCSDGCAQVTLIVFVLRVKTKTITEFTEVFTQNSAALGSTFTNCLSLNF